MSEPTKLSDYMRLRYLGSWLAGLLMGFLLCAFLKNADPPLSDYNDKVRAVAHDLWRIRGEGDSTGEEANQDWLRAKKIVDDYGTAVKAK